MSEIVLLSGGLDSTTLLFDRRWAGEDVIGLFVDYGQRMAATELSAARAVTAAAGVPLNAVHLPLPRDFGSGWLQSIPSTPAWEDHKVTHWPHRNLFLITLAAMLAGQKQARNICLGFMDIQAEPFPDSTPEFVEGLQAVLRQTDPQLTLQVPYVHWTKRQVAVRALELRVPVDLTFSCTYASDHHCAVCPSCLDRIDALQYARTLANS